jgi:hypothetical protein
MDWKDEWIDSTETAEDFLRTSLLQAGLPPHDFKNVFAGYDDQVLFQAVRQGFVGNVNDHPNELFFSLRGSRESRAVAVFEDIIVDRNFRRKSGGGGLRLGARGLKALFGCDFVQGASVIHLQTVCSNGVSLGPYLGGVPAEEPTELADIITKKVNGARRELPNSDHELLNCCADLAKREPISGWIKLGRAYKDLSASGRSVREGVIETVLRDSCDRSLYLFPASGMTRAYIEEVVGYIGPFRPVDSQNKFYGAAEAVESCTP